MRWIVLPLGLLVALGIEQPAAAQVGDIRFGNLHAHTSYSDGLGTPAEAFAAACDAGLDFFAITEHNHPEGDGSGARRDGLVIGRQPELYSGSAEGLVEMSDAANRPGDCVTIYGQEFSTISQGNHVNVFDVDEVIAVADGRFDLLLEWLTAHPDQAGAPALLQFNHPASGKKAKKDYGRDDFGDGSELAWLEVMPRHVSLIEVFNAPALQPGEGQRTHDRSSLYRRYLNMGFHLAPSVGQDNHFRNWGVSTEARVAVIAPVFTRRGVIDALRRRHAYATEDANLRVVLRSGAALMGDIAAPPGDGGEIPLTLQIVDEDSAEADAIYRVDVYKDVAGGPVASAPVETFEFTGNQPEPVPLEGITFEEEGQYVFLKITQQANESGIDGAGHDEEHPMEDVVWTAPIWFETQHFHDEAPGTRAISIASLLPNPPGDDAEREQATLRNAGTQPMDMKGWQLRDLAGQIWVLDTLAIIAPGEEKSIRRERQPMALNNNGDEIELVAPDGAVVQLLTYGEVAEGQVVQP